MVFFHSLRLLAKRHFPHVLRHCGAATGRARRSGTAFPPSHALRIAKNSNFGKGYTSGINAALASFPFSAAPLGSLIRGGSFGLRSYRCASIHYRPSIATAPPLPFLSSHNGSKREGAARRRFCHRQSPPAFLSIRRASRIFCPFPSPRSPFPRGKRERAHARGNRLKG